MINSVIAYLLAAKKLPFFAILKDNAAVEEVSSAYRFFADFFSLNADIARFYSYEIPPVSSIPPSYRIIRERLRSVYRLLNSSDGLAVFASLGAVLQPVISQDDFLDRFISLKRDQQVDMRRVIDLFGDMFYRRVEMVEDYGEFAVRGDIIDIYTPLYDKPVRISFFDDVIESIRLFTPANQRSAGELEEAEIVPACEYAFDDDGYGYGRLKNGVFIDSYIEGFRIFKSFDERFLKELLSAFELYSKSYGYNGYMPEDRFNRLIGSGVDLEIDGIASFEPVFVENASIEEKIEKMHRLSRKHLVVVACASETRMERVGAFLEQKGISFSKNRGVNRGIVLVDGYLKRGFLDRSRGIAFVSFEDLFGAVAKPVGIRKTGSVQKSFEAGTLVVHRRYGIGVYRGIKKLQIEGETQDFVEIEYAKKDRLFVPVYAVDNLFEYHGKAALSVLGSKKWQATQERIKRSIKKILSELVATYARRELVKREPFDVETLEFKEFEALFEYDETPDQAKAIEDIKKDMSSEKPMDRLVCGDVSFGKTEVAMRACAISVFNGRQAVVMVPTTILSIQHYNTFRERFSAFPVNIALLNRFTTKKEKEKLLVDLKRGVVDILICTHSVYSDKIAFANLGIVVIDEEHRFGVKIKEHFKASYPHVDMLYLSATPIPRTLNMALKGIFDISIMKTAPQDRKPIETFVLRRKSSVIRDAVLKEISRGGSVYFVHNSIETIENVKRELDLLLPSVKKEIVHAKMPKGKIKDVLERFNSGEFEMLISTSIIESGLDIKSVNTIIIDNADKFGLADLYQLRGRVGRADRQAYAYLLVGSNITENAKSRLYYMKEYMERGVGFNLAFKDMEIRGGGNILGKDQSGNIKAVGFDTYVALVEEAINEMRNQPPERDVEIKCSFKAYIDDNFADSNRKLVIYKMISSLRSEEELEQAEEALKEEFGKLTDEVKNLLLIALIKIYAKRASVKRLSISPKGVLVEFYVDAQIDTDRLIKEVNTNNGKFISETSVFFGNFGATLSEIAAKLKKVLQNIV